MNFALNGKYIFQAFVNWDWRTIPVFILVNPISSVAPDDLHQTLSSGVYPREGKPLGPKPPRVTNWVPKKKKKERERGRKKEGKKGEKKKDQRG